MDRSIHQDIMRFGRHLSNTLKGKTNTYFIKMRMSAKEAVIIAFAAP